MISILRNGTFFVQFIFLYRLLFAFYGLWRKAEASKLGIKLPLSTNSQKPLRVSSYLTRKWVIYVAYMLYVRMY